MSDSGSEELRHLVEVMAKALVDVPDEVTVAEIQGEQTTVIELITVVCPRLFCRSALCGT